MRSAMHAVMWMLPLYLHINQKSDYDMMILKIGTANSIFLGLPNLHDILGLACEMS